MPEFMSDDFLLQSETARVLYHEHAAGMPIYDYHCHVPAVEIAKDRQFVSRVKPHRALILQPLIDVLKAESLHSAGCFWIIELEKY